MIERHHCLRISKSTVSNVKNGYTHVGEPDLTEKEVSRLNALIDGEEVCPQEDIPRLEKLGYVEVFYRAGVVEANKHFNETCKDGFFTLQKAEEIVSEVKGWIKEGTLQDENEHWFAEQMMKRKNE